MAKRVRSSTNPARLLAGRRASTAASTSASFGIASSYMARPVAVRVTELARLSVIDFVRCVSPLASMRATISARVERSMPVRPTNSLCETPSCSAKTAKTANWRCVRPLAPSAAACRSAAACCARCSKWLGEAFSAKDVAAEPCDAGGSPAPATGCTGDAS